MKHWIHTIKGRLLVLLFSFVCWNSNCQSIILTEDFEGGSFPAGWTQQTISTDGGWNYGDSLSLSSQYFRIPSHTHFLATNDNSCQCDKRSDYMVTPFLNLSYFTTVFLNFEMYFEGERNWGLGAGIYAEKATLEISLDSGLTWQAIDTLHGLKYFWQTVEFNLSEYAGNPSVLIAFKYNDYSYFSGYQAYGWTIDNVIIYEPAPRDIFFKSIDNNSYSLAGTNFINGTFRNIGADTIKNFEANYRINDSTIITSVFTDVIIAPFDYYTFINPVSFISNPGIDTVYAWLDNVNSLGADNNLSNDSVSKTISFVPYFAQRKVMVEDFTSANCTGCAQSNAWLNPLLDSNENIVAQIRYHGLDDEMYLFNPEENDDRADFYDISSLPSIFGDGNTAIRNQNDIDSLAAIPALFQIQLNAIYNDSIISIDATTTSLADFISGSLNVNIVLAENVQYSEPPGVNGETYFPCVMRKMFPHASGSSIGRPSISQQDHFYFTFPRDTVMNPDNMFAEAFVQDKYSKTVYQSAHTMLIPETTAFFSEFNLGSVNIYPQPATTVLYVDLSIFSPFLEIRIFDMKGKLVLSKMPDNNQPFSIDISDLNTGLYLLMIDGEASCKKLISVFR